MDKFWDFLESLVWALVAVSPIILLGFMFWLDIRG